MMEPEIVVAMISSGFSFLGAVGGTLAAVRSKMAVLEEGAKTLAKGQEELRHDLQATLTQINGRCDHHHAVLGGHGERITAVERDVVHFGDRVRALRGEASGLRGKSEGEKP